MSQDEKLRRSGMRPVYRLVAGDDVDFTEGDDLYAEPSECDVNMAASDSPTEPQRQQHHRRHGVITGEYDEAHYCDLAGQGSLIPLLGGEDDERPQSGGQLSLSGGRGQIIPSRQDSSRGGLRQKVSPDPSPSDASVPGHTIVGSGGASSTRRLLPVSSMPQAVNPTQLQHTSTPVKASLARTHTPVTDPGCLLGKQSKQNTYQASPRFVDTESTTDANQHNNNGIMSVAQSPPSRDNMDVTAHKPGKALTHTDSRHNAGSDVTNHHNAIQPARTSTRSRPRSNSTITYSLIGEGHAASLTGLSAATSREVSLTSDGGPRGENYYFRQGGNRADTHSVLAARLPVPDTADKRFSLPDRRRSSSSTEFSSHFDNLAMGDLLAFEKNGSKPVAVSETQVHRSDVDPNRITNGHKTPRKSSEEKVVACKNKVGDQALEVDHNDKGSGPCGWGKFQFDVCQTFLRAKWFLLVLTLCGACQGMAVNGFVNTSISTIERRFEISSTEAGLIASCYDIMFVILVIPISYFGGQGHKPRYLGIGIFVMGIGSFVFALPHFISDTYHVENADETTCRINSNSSSACTSASLSSLSNYKYVFYLGQLLHGAGATPLYTLGVIYLDENVPQRSSAFYNGIFYTGAIIGPAIGYMVGAKFLDIYTDVTVDPKSLGLDPSNPKWVGAWWIGFIISGMIGVLLSLPLLAFPAVLPGSLKYTKERGKETHASKTVDQTGQQRGFRDILLSLKYLLTNIPFMFINVAAAADGILVAGFSTFMPKFIEYEFGLPAGTAALYVGLAVVPAGGGATFGGGLIVKCFNLKMRGILRLCTVMSFILCILAASLVMECQTVPFAGVTLSYGQTDVGAASFLGKNLGNTCNEKCMCSENDFYPVCGRDKVLYFSPCYAGCTHVTIDNGIKRYANCSCINFNLTESDYTRGTTHLAEFGKCEFYCEWLPLFLLCFGFMIVFVFITSMPSLIATLRCVPDHQRSLGLGIQWIVARCLGSIPGPILFGKMFDLACLVWQKRCSDDGSCFFYDTHKLSLYLLALALSFAIAAAVSFLLALCFYKIREAEDEIILQEIRPSPQPQSSVIQNSRDDANLPDTHNDGANTGKDETGTKF